MQMIAEESGLSPVKLGALKDVSAKMRGLILDSVYSAQSGHLGGSLSIVEILAYLYFNKMNIDPSRPHWKDRDRLVLSKGHCAPALYAVLALKGFFPTDELYHFRKMGHMLQGHPDVKSTPGVDISTGSLGQGLSVGCGMSLAAKQNGDAYHTYVILGDGELQEGQIWEAAMFAGAKKLNNLTAFIDCNNLQMSGHISEILEISPIGEKLKSFGWSVQIIDGHNFNDINSAILKAEKNGTPVAIMCNTIKGKGVSFMENNVYWHGNPPNAEQYAIARDELSYSKFWNCHEEQHYY
jgi:transketolase